MSETNQPLISDILKMIDSPKDILMQKSLKQVKEACMEKIVLNGRLLKSLEDFEFRKIIDPILKQLYSNQTTINRKNIFLDFKERERQIRI